jgi:hypothetical protein
MGWLVESLVKRIGPWGVGECVWDSSQDAEARQRRILPALAGFFLVAECGGRFCPAGAKGERTRPRGNVRHFQVHPVHLEVAWKMAGTVLRNGPANARRMNLRMNGLVIRSWSVIHLSFSRTARRSVPAFSCFQAVFLGLDPQAAVSYQLRHPTGTSNPGLGRKCRRSILPGRL